jgi:hypothetical protein
LPWFLASILDLLLDQDRREKQLRAENCQYNRLTIERCYPP